MPDPIFVDESHAVDSSLRAQSHWLKLCLQPPRLAWWKPEVAGVGQRGDGQAVQIRRFEAELLRLVYERSMMVIAASAVLMMSVVCSGDNGCGGGGSANGVPDEWDGCFDARVSWEKSGWVPHKLLGLGWILLDPGFSVFIVSLIFILGFQKVETASSYLVEDVTTSSNVISSA